MRVWLFSRSRLVGPADELLTNRIRVCGSVVALAIGVTVVNSNEHGEDP